MKTKNRKGIMLTLATVVLFVLMLAELVTYVSLNINYNVIVSTSSSVSGGATATATLNSAASAFLHQSLQNALASLIRYEGTPTIRNGNFINNTAYALQSLMSNGMVYGTGMQGYMGGSTLVGFTSAMGNQISAEGMNMIITNATLTVFQNSPFTISANYTALAVVNSTHGLFTFPLSATASVSLNGTQSLYGIESGDPFIIKPMPSYPKAVLIGNAFASSGSATTTLFSYGAVYYVGGTPSCASVPSQYQNANYILVTPSAASISSTICNMGGLVTYTIGSPASTVPYLVYPGASNIVSILQTGTSVLLSVKGLSLLNVSALQGAIQNGYSFASPYTPSYLDWAQGSLMQRSRNGMFSFNLLNRMLAGFTGSGYVTTGTSGLPSGSSQRSAFAWIYFTGSPASGTYVVESYGGSAAGAASKFGISSGKLYFSGNSNDFTSTLSVTPNSYHFVGYTYSTSLLTLYLDGSSQSTTLSSSLSTTATAAGIGADASSANVNKFSGQIADVQIYSTVLAPTQAAQLYQEGIDSVPVSGAGLVGWWPLNGDFNDYSGQSNNGIATSVAFSGLKDYQADPIWGGSLYGTNALNANALNMTEGVVNCGFSAQCYSSGLEHLYLANSPLSGTYSYALNESTALGLSNSILPP